MAEYQALTPRERAQRRIDALNADAGTEDSAEYDCKRCGNRGGMFALEERNGCFYERFTECRCMEIRRSVRRLRASGLEGVIHELRLENFEAQANWQRAMLDTARKYAAEGADKGAWLYMGGQPGCGKTHLCTGVAGKLLQRMPLLYVIWPEASKRLKAAVNDSEEYARQISPILETEAVYIDDLFKPTKSETGVQMPTAADVKLAFEIINHRYVQRLPTIISSEWMIEAMADIDEATASRIAERSRGYRVGVNADRGKNYRFRD